MIIFQPQMSKGETPNSKYVANVPLKYVMKSPPKNVTKINPDLVKFRVNGVTRNKFATKYMGFFG